MPDPYGFFLAGLGWVFRMEGFNKTAICYG